MKYIKTYEQNIEDVDFDELTKQLKDKFFVHKVNKHYTNEKYKIILVDKVRENIYKNRENTKKSYAPGGGTFTILDDNKIQNMLGYWAHYYTEEEFNNIEFLSANELFEKYPEICESLYKYLVDYKERRKNSRQDNIDKQYNNFIKQLETIPDIQTYIQANKYNL